MDFPRGLLQKHGVGQSMSGRQIAIILPPALRAGQVRQVAHAGDIPPVHRQPDAAMGTGVIGVRDRMKGNHRLLMRARVSAGSAASRILSRLARSPPLATLPYWLLDNTRRP